MPTKKTTTKKKTTTAKVTKKATVKKATPKKKVVAKKVTAKKAAPKKKVVAKKVTAKKAAPKKKVTAKKATKKSVSKKTINKSTIVTLDDLFASTTLEKPKKNEEIDFDALFEALDLNEDNKITIDELFDSGKNQDAEERITLEELFAEMDANSDNKVTLEELFSFVESQAPTTPAYSSIAGTVAHNKILEDGSEELFTQEEESFHYHQAWHQKFALSLGVALVALVIGGMWFQVTRGYFEDIKENDDSAFQAVQRTIETNKRLFNDAKVDIDNVIDSTR